MLDDVRRDYDGIIVVRDDCRTLRSISTGDSRLKPSARHAGVKVSELRVAVVHEVRLDVPKSAFGGGTSVRINRNAVHVASSSIGRADRLGQNVGDAHCALGRADVGRNESGVSVPVHFPGIGWQAARPHGNSHEPSSGRWR